MSVNPGEFSEEEQKLLRLGVDPILLDEARIQRTLATAREITEARAKAGSPNPPGDSNPGPGDAIVPGL